jgi:outer membrane protein assembly factor BamB
MLTTCGKRRLGEVLAGAVLAAGLLQSGQVLAQSFGQNRTSPGGRQFPSWQREPDSSVPPPFPEARPGRHEVAFSLALDAPAAGLAQLGDGSLAVALLDGRLQRFDLGGVLLDELDLAAGQPDALVGAGRLAVVAAGPVLAGYGPDGLAWRLELPAAPAWTPVHRTAGLVVTSRDGLARLLAPSTGAIRWEAAVGESASCGPAQVGDLLVWGTGDGRLIARAAADGASRWSVEVGDSVSAVGADPSSVYFAASGRTGRSKRGKGPFLGRLAVAGAPEPVVEWRARVGGESVVEPLLLGRVVAFACHDGYLHALRRSDGGLAWRTDLPARTLTPPRLVGGRLDAVLPLTGWVVAVAADNGAVMGWMELPDRDETFVGAPVLTGGYTVAATSFGRLVALRWTYDESG